MKKKKLMIEENNELQIKIKKLKKLCMKKIYNCNGELLRVLDSEYIISLLNNVSFENKIKLENTLIFKRRIVSEAEFFLKNLDYYIGYIRDTYFINYLELPFIIEYSLTNSFSKILLSKEDIHKDSNYKVYHCAFIRMFLLNLYSNIKSFSRSDELIKRFYNEIKKLKFNDDNDIIKIEEKFIKLINHGGNYLCQPFMSRNQMNNNSISNWKMQLQMIIEEYYDKQNLTT